MYTILIAGGTGLIGTHLSTFLRKQGHEVRLLSRRPHQVGHLPAFKWDITKRYIDLAALKGVDTLINLAGANIANRPWTKGRKAELIASRVAATRLLRDALSRQDTLPQRYIAASAIGYYGNSADEWVDEWSQPQSVGFLSTLAQQWEAAAEEIAALGIPTARLRIGMVLAREGGTLKPMTFSARLGLAPYFGRGQQWFSWIHVHDLVHMIYYLIEHRSATGPWNGVSPNPVQLKVFVKTLAHALGRPAISLPIPAKLIRLAMGQMADLLLHSTRVCPRRWLEQTDFQFQHPLLEQALAQLFSKPKNISGLGAIDGTLP